MMTLKEFLSKPCKVRQEFFQNREKKKWVRSLKKEIDFPPTTTVREGSSFLDIYMTDRLIDSKVCIAKSTGLIVEVITLVRGTEKLPWRRLIRPGHESFFRYFCRGIKWAEKAKTISNRLDVDYKNGWAELKKAIEKLTLIPIPKSYTIDRYNIADAAITAGGDYDLLVFECIRSGIGIPEKHREKLSTLDVLEIPGYLSVHSLVDSETISMATEDVMQSIKRLKKNIYNKYGVTDVDLQILVNGEEV